MASQYHDYDDDQDLKNIHFFKVILESTLQDGKLMMPRSFVKRYGEELSNPIILMVPNGAQWEVHWKKRDRGDIWFHIGWEKFAQHYSLSNGHFLVFRYEGGSQFLVLIFDDSALEIDYPRSKSSTNIDAEGTNAYYEVDAEKNGDDDDTPLQQPHKIMKTNNTGARAEGSSVNAKKWSKAEFKIRKKKAHEDGIEGSTAYESAIIFKSDYPFFIRPIYQSYLRSIMFLPTRFTKKYMKGLMEGTATINVVLSEDEHTEKTPREVRFKFNKSSNRAFLTSGWVSIAQDYNLKEGDVCVFEMIHSHATSFEFKMTIFQGTHVPSSNEL